MLSVVIPTMGRPTVVKTVESLTKALRFDEIEVFVCGKIHNGESAQAIRAFCDRFSNIEHLSIEYETGDSSRKKNEGAKRASAEIVAFIDDDVYVKENWPEQIVSTFVDEQVGLISGPSLVPEDINLSGRLAGLALSSPAAGYVADRYTEGKQVLCAVNWSRIIGCNMAYRKSVLESIGMFDPEYWPGEEMIASFRTEQAGWTLMFNSNAQLYHYPRQSIVKFWKQIWGYGATRIRLIRGGAKFEPTTIVPGVWVLSLLALGLASCFHPIGRLLLAIDLMLYAVASAWFTFGMVKQTRRASDVLLFLMIPYMHLSYGLAEWFELFVPNKDLSERMKNA